MIQTRSCRTPAVSSILPDFSPLPPALQSPALLAWERIAATAGTLPPAVLGQLPRVLAASEFIGRWCAGAADRLPELSASGDLGRAYTEGEMRRRALQALDGARELPALQAALRLFRNREMVRIAWRDLCGEATLEQTLTDLSELADAAVDLSLERLHQALVAVHGEPRCEAGAAQRLFVLAMGKLGARELNYSSDIDIVMAYPKAGETTGGRRPLSNHEFFTRLGQRLVRALDEVTAQGMVFRVDLRLRPFGDSGPLVLSMSAIEGYYEAHARDWERYALIKARCMAGDTAAGDRLLATLRPFVYRRYLDFGAMEALRDMKNMIREEVSRRGLENDIKRGSGGIREVEFIAQCFQLIRGGREPLLRTASLAGALEAARRLGLLPGESVDELLEAYRFLRNVEHRLQQVSDQQTQSLPDDATGRARLAFGMGFESWEQFAAALQARRACVQHHFDALLSGPEESVAVHPAGEPDPWQECTGVARGTEVLQHLGFDQPAQAAQALATLHGSARLRGLSATGRSRLDELMPRLIRRATAGPAQTETLLRVLPLIENVATRSVYLSLLNEHPPALDQLLRLCSASPWVAKTIAAAPMLLDDLLEPGALYSPPEPGRLRRDMLSRLERHGEGDPERRLDVLRQFKNTQVLRVAAADIVGRLPLSEVSNRLSAIAETVLVSALDLAWADLSQWHGVPRCVDGGAERAARFGVVAYGKLGGLELGYASDLDIVFLHDSRGSAQQTNGSRTLDNAVFFTRLAQRVIHYLSTLTGAGRAYEVDTRLRPSGSSGLLVSTLDAFADYQARTAWTWEHQALIRARPVAGDEDVGRAFQAIRLATLSKARDAEALRADLLSMRRRMRAELDRGDRDHFDIKQGVGGMTDIEFMVQYAVLRWGAECPRLLAFTDNLRLLEQLAAVGRLAPDDCTALRDAYFAFRAEVHRLSLQETPARVPVAMFTAEREAVQRIWHNLLEVGPA